jgi:hypothetical protein
VSVDDETLWVYVHAVGPGPYDAVAEVGARSLLQRLWTDVHRSASHHEAR